MADDTHASDGAGSERRGTVAIGGLLVLFGLLGRRRREG